MIKYILYSKLDVKNIILWNFQLLVVLKDVGIKSLKTPTLPLDTSLLKNDAKAQKLIYPW